MVCLLPTRLGLEVDLDRVGTVTRGVFDALYSEDSVGYSVKWFGSSGIKLMTRMFFEYIIPRSKVGS